MKKQETEITETTVEVKTSPRRNSLKVCYPGGDILKIVYTNAGHKVETAGVRMRGQVSDATICKILAFVRTYASNTESDTARFNRLGEFFLGTASLAEAVARF